MSSNTTYSGPYARAAHIYRQAGWPAPLPLGNRAGVKYPPPQGWTGHGAPYPSAADVQSWMETHGDRNIGIRMPQGVIGLDVDHYKDKTGADTLAELEQRYGPLPPTWVSSARPAPSGIRFYRVPTHLDGHEVNWPGEAGKFIEIIQPGHRYAVVWPSTNPEAAGALYEWRDPVDGQFRVPPRLDMLAELPEAWLRGLALPYERVDKASLGSEQYAVWWSELRPGGPHCEVIHTVWMKAVDSLRNNAASRHETARDAVRALVALGGEGHRGAATAVEGISRVFATAVGPERIANGEWHRLLAGAVELAAAKTPEPLQHCEHDAVAGMELPPGFFELVEEQRLREREAAAAVIHSRLDELAEQIEALPKAERAEAVRRAIPEIADWDKIWQAAARDLLTRRSGLSDLGVTEFTDLLKAEERDRRRAAEEAELKERHRRHEAAVSSASEQGLLLPPPHDPLSVATALAPRLERPARWWRGDFYLWDGTRYVEWRSEAVEHWLYRQTGPAHYELSGDKGISPWQPTESKIGSLSHALSRGVLYRDSAAEPDDSAQQVVCRNGVYDVASDTVLPHDPWRFNLQSVPFDFDPRAQCPTWRWFLDDVLPADAQQLLQEWIGYLISGRTDMEKILHLQGLPRSGKGTTAHVIEALLGEENVASPSMPSLVGTFGEQPLIGKTLAVFSDVNWQFRDIAEAVEIVKKISGRDSRDVQRKNREAWHGRLGVRFMIMGNDLPSFRDASGALAYRMMHVRFPGTVMGREDPTLKTRLLDELPGILLWAVEGLRRLDANGTFTEPESARELASEVRRQQGPVQPFLEDACARADNAPPVPLDELFPVYVAWARQSGVEHVLDRERFSRALTSAGLAVERKMINGVRARRVHGIVPQIHDGASAWVRLLNPYGSVPPTA